MEEAQERVKQDQFIDLTVLLRRVGDRQGDLISLSEAWETVLGDRVDDLLGQDLVDRVHPEDASATRDAFYGSMAARKPVALRNRLRHSDGSWCWLDWQIWQPDEERVLGTARDISEQVRLEKRLRDSEELLRESQREAQLGHYVFDAGENRWTPSETLRQILGIDDAYMCDLEGWVRIVHPLDREEMRQRLVEDVLGKRMAFNHDFRILRVSDGTERWVHGRGRAKVDETGETCGLFGVIQDITERRLAKQSIEREHAVLARAEKVAQLGSWRLALDTGAASWTEGMHEVFGIDRDSFTGDATAHLALAHPDDSDAIEQAAAEVLAGRTPQPVEYRILHPDGDVKWVRGEAMHELDAEGRTVALVGYCQDVTERKRYQADLLESNERLTKMVHDVADAMGKAVEVRDPYTQGHQERVARVAKAIAFEMGLPRDDIACVEMAAIVHDIGKLGVPVEILTKPGPLSSAEFELIEMHPIRSHEILRPISFPWPVAQIALEHHERMDGSGYPSGLAGSDILLPSRILAVADVIEAMASDRPYRPALGLETAIAKVSCTSPEKYDQDVADACVRLFETGNIGL